MKKTITTTLLFIISLIVLSQEPVTKQDIQRMDAKLEELNTRLASIQLKQAGEELRGVTFGFSAGFSRLFKRQYDYFLDPANNYLQKQKLGKTNLVISTVASVKLSKLTLQKKEKGYSLVRTGIPEKKFDDNTFLKTPTDEISLENARWHEKFVLNLALNLGEIGSDVSFNKQIDGGIGLGYLLTADLQLAAFIDIIRTRQLRDYIVSSYKNKTIPKGSEFYTALDPSDNNLFYNKTFTGMSLKLIIALNPKKNN